MKEHMLLIAEKPDLMRQIETVYKKHKSDIPYEITFTSQRGHLVALKQPNELDESLTTWDWDTLPFHPEDYGGWKYKVIKEKKTGSFLTSQERYEQIYKELKSGKYDAVINAGDPDQEGELLIRLVLKEAGNKLPVKRFWTNDLTEKAIVDALKNLRDDDHDPMLTRLLDAAYGRQHSDYRFGMNLSRAATLKMNTTVSCGRVETPILSIVCKREEEIRNFKPTTTYGVQSEYSEDFKGQMFDEANASTEENADEESKSGIIRFKTKKEAEDVIKTLPNQAEVLSVEKKEVKTYAPKLFKLASAQVAAGKLGYNDAKTLAIIQGLYEKKLLSYPRTDCEYLSSKENFRGLLDACACVPELKPWVDKITAADIETVRKSKRWINDKQLEDSGHSALKPTDNTFDFSSLSKEERDIYVMVAKRFVSIFLPPLIQNQTVLIAEAGGKKFRSSGKTLVDKGYSELYGASYTDMMIPPHKKGDIIDVDKYSITEKTTTCPKRFTSPDMIAACENPLKYLNDASLKTLGKRLKIGTPATRSAIIRKLIDKYAYIEEKKEKKTTYLVPTKLGEDIIQNLGSCDICKVDLTGIWEEQLEDVRTGKMTISELEKEMKDHVAQLVQDIKTTPMKDLSSYSTRKRYVKIAVCPSCGKDVVAGEKGCFCTGWKSGCPVCITKKQWGVTFSDDDCKKLLAGDIVEKEMKDDDEKTYTARLKYDPAKGGLYDTAKPPEKVMKCPVCGGDIMVDRRRFYCTGPSVGKTCNVSGWINICNAELTQDDIQDLLDKKEIEKTCSKDGKSWQQKMKYNFTDHKVEFVRKEHASSGYKCPCCKKSDMYETDKMLRCMDSKCGFVIWKTVCAHDLTRDEIKSIIKTGKTDVITGLVSKAGREFSAALKVNKRGKKMDFEFEKK